MTRKIGYLLVPLALLLLMAACQPKYEEPEVTDPTLPSISLDQTPLQQLAAAIEKTEAEEKFDIRYGIKTRVGEETAEDVHSQTVTEDQSFDRDRMWGKAPELAVRQNFLEQFGNQSLRIIPSNTGTDRYPAPCGCGEYRRRDSGTGESHSAGNRRRTAGCRRLPQCSR